MKTIKEAASECAMVLMDKYDMSIAETPVLENAFEKGAEYVNRWISLIEKNPEDLVHIYYFLPTTKYTENVLLKLQSGNFKVGKRVFYRDSGWDWHRGRDYDILNSATHWRPIEYK